MNNHSNPNLLSLDRSSGRGKNWSVMEDEALCLAWLDVSQDPIASVDQKADTFYERIFTQFCEICKLKKLPVDPQYRSPTSLKARWSLIQRLVNKFCGCFSQVRNRNRSGTSNDDDMNDAYALYKSAMNSSFTLMHAYKILEPAPKWNQFVSDKKKPLKRKAIEVHNNPDVNESFVEREETSEIESTGEGDVSSANSNRPRPTGKKAAKLEQQVKVLTSSSTSLAESGKMLAETARLKAKDNKDRTTALMRLANFSIMAVDTDNLSDTAREYFEIQQKLILKQVQNEQTSSSSNNGAE